MQSIGANHQIEFTHASTLERGSNAMIRLLDTVYAVAKNRFHPAFDLAEDRRRQVRSGEACKSTVRYS